MKIRKVSMNNRKKAFEIRTSSHEYVYPYSKLEHASAVPLRIAEASVDTEIGREGFTYALDTGEEGSVHIDEVLDYNRDPAYLRDALLYKLTLEVRKRVERCPLSRREIIRRLGTSATQFYRLLDQTNYGKTVDQMLKLLQALDCDVDLVIRDRPV